MSIPSREELRQEWKKHIEWKADIIDRTIRNVEIAVNGCLPEVIEIATRASAHIGSFRRTIADAEGFRDITEAEHDKYLAQSYRQDEKLSELTDRFKGKCKCQLK